MTNNEFNGGFSFRDDVIGKPADNELQNLMLGARWKWAEGAQPEHLAHCLTEQGFAVTPGHWRGGHKSKKHGELLETNYLLLDYDKGMSWEDAKQNEFFSKNALFAYTSPSHGKPGKGCRFRIVFAIDRPIHDSKTFDMVIQGLRTLLPAQDDPAINAASLLYGNPNAELHIYNYDNRLNAEEAYYPAALALAKRKMAIKSAAQIAEYQQYSTDNSLNRIRRWLSNIPNSARSTWVRVAACLRNIEAQGHEWAYPSFEEWSAKGYADFDAHECIKLWDSLEQSPGGFTRLKHLSNYFAKHPFEEEVDTQTFNEFINNETFNS